MSIELRYLDRAAWGSGPWDNEPDAVSWISKVGFACEMRRGEYGYWCGYVGVDPKHPAKSYLHATYSVHMGISWTTASDRLAESYKDEGSIPENLWWLGFHCCHVGDMIPRHVPDGSMVYRDVFYVRAQCENLAEQIDAIGMLGEVGFGGPRHLRGDYWTAPAWAVEYAQRVDIPRAERLRTLLALTDPVAAQFAALHGVR